MLKKMLTTLWTLTEHYTHIPSLKLLYGLSLCKIISIEITENCLSNKSLNFRRNLGLQKWEVWGKSFGNRIWVRKSEKKKKKKLQEKLSKESNDHNLLRSKIRMRKLAKEVQREIKSLALLSYKFLNESMKRSPLSNEWNEQREHYARKRDRLNFLIPLWRLIRS